MGLGVGGVPFTVEVGIQQPRESSSVTTTCILFTLPTEHKLHTVQTGQKAVVHNSIF